MFVNEKQDDYGGHRTDARQASSLVKQKGGQLHETGRASMLITDFQDMEENDTKRRSDAKRGHRLIEQDTEGLCSDSPRHSMLSKTGQTVSFVKKVRGETQIDDCRRSETRRTGSFVVEPREEPQRENQRDNGGRCLEKR